MTQKIWSCYRRNMSLTTSSCCRRNKNLTTSNCRLRNKSCQKIWSCFLKSEKMKTMKNVNRRHRRGTVHMMLQALLQGLSPLWR